MSESEIIIPVSSISRKNGSAKVDKSSSVDRKNVEVTLSKFLRLIDDHDFNSLSQKYGDLQISLSADLLLDLAAFEDDNIVSESPKVSYLSIGLLGALFLSFLIMLIYLV